MTTPTLLAVHDQPAPAAAATGHSLLEEMIGRRISVAELPSNWLG